MLNIDEIRNTVICGDALNVLAEMPDNSVNCCVTSPPYWGLRDYGVEGQLGLEKTPEEFISKLVAIFREVRRVLRDDGTCWVNLGDTYATSGTVGSGGTNNAYAEKLKIKGVENYKAFTPRKLDFDVKPKDLVGIPWRFALALQADGWYLRQDIIWHKPNPMPESVTDRCTKSHEYIFLLTKSAKYWYDAEAIKEDSVDDESYSGRRERNAPTMAQFDLKNLKNAGSIKEDGELISGQCYPKRNKRSVWTIPTQAYSEAHFATFPEKLVEPCILAGCPKEVCPKCGKARIRMIKPTDEYAKKLGKGYNDHTQDLSAGFIKDSTTGARCTSEYETIGFTSCSCGVGFVPGIVLEPFCGSGTSCAVAAYNQRDYIGIELNQKYIEMAKRRIGEAETGVTVKEQKQGQKALFE